MTPAEKVAKTGPQATRLLLQTIATGEPGEQLIFDLLGSARTLSNSADTARSDIEFELGMLTSAPSF